MLGGSSSILNESHSINTTCAATCQGIMPDLKLTLSEIDQKALINSAADQQQ